jgi:hypothetical protein
MKIIEKTLAINGVVVMASIRSDTAKAARAETCIDKL